MTIVPFAPRPDNRKAGERALDAVVDRWSNHQDALINQQTLRHERRVDLSLASGHAFIIPSETFEELRYTVAIIGQEHEGWSIRLNIKEYPVSDRGGKPYAFAQPIGDYWSSLRNESIQRLFIDLQDVLGLIQLDYSDDSYLSTKAQTDQMEFFRMWRKQLPAADISDGQTLIELLSVEMTGSFDDYLDEADDSPAQDFATIRENLGETEVIEDPFSHSWSEDMQPADHFATRLPLPSEVLVLGRRFRSDLLCITLIRLKPWNIGDFICLLWDEVLSTPLIVASSGSSELLKDARVLDCLRAINRATDNGVVNYAEAIVRGQRSDTYYRMIGVDEDLESTGRNAIKFYLDVLDKLRPRAIIRLQTLSPRH